MANQHVVPNNGKWQLKREIAVRATKTFDTQKRQLLTAEILRYTNNQSL